MRYIIEDKKYHFKSAFDTETGTYVRTGILDAHGIDTGVDPFMASFPHLIDVGVMGRCIHGKTGLCAKAGIGCYQCGLLIEQPNMTVESFRWIADQFPAEDLPVPRIGLFHADRRDSRVVLGLRPPRLR